MKKLFFCFLTAWLLGSHAYAGQARVNWQEPDKYTDIREGNEVRENFRLQLFRDFELIFDDLAKQLPDGYLLEVAVTDVDLAGEVDWMRQASRRDVRILKHIYWPRMSFSYTLKNAAGEPLVSGKEDIKDMAYLASGDPGNNRLGYEQRMLKSWFKKQQRNKYFPVNDKPSTTPVNQAVR